MIMGCREEREIGKRYDGYVTDSQMKRHKMPYVVIRKATYEEWVEENKDNPNIIFAPKDANFYEVSVD